MTKRPIQGRPYPRPCHACKAKSVQPAYEPRTLEVKYDGAMHTITVPRFPVNRCEKCGVQTVGVEADDALDAALRDYLGLLRASEIRAARGTLGLTQHQLAERIGCASETVSRWETAGIVQSRMSDRMLRAFFNLEEFRGFLASLPVDDSLGRVAVPDADPADFAPLALVGSDGIQKYEMDDTLPYITGGMVVLEENAIAETRAA